jgi:hypothetical protein
MPDTNAMNITATNGTTLAIVGKNAIGNAQIKGGKMRKPDTFTFGLLTPDTVTVFGLYRGRYGEFKATAWNVYIVLVAAGCTKDAEDVRAACMANGYDCKNPTTTTP